MSALDMQAGSTETSKEIIEIRRDNKWSHSWLVLRLPSQQTTGISFMLVLVKVAYSLTTHHPGLSARIHGTGYTGHLQADRRCDQFLRIWGV
jgi:hypothetical protein